MMMRTIKKNLFFIPAILITLGVISCGSRTTPTPIPRFDIWLETPTVALPFIQENTPTAEPTTSIVKKVVFLSEGLDQERNEIKSVFEKIAQEKGFEFENASLLDDKTLESNVIMVVAFQSKIIEPYYSKYPQIKFIVIGNDQIQESQNLIRVPYQTASNEKMEFLAGYIAALVSDNWRAGILSDGKENTILAFDNGFRFFCGLCRPAYPPFVQYPILIEGVSSNTDIAAKLQENAVKVVFVSSKIIENHELIKLLADNEIYFISTIEPPSDLKPHWIVVLQNKTMEEVIKENFDQWLVDNSEKHPAALRPFNDVNESMFTLGKQKLAEKCYEELILGEIDPSVKY